MSGDTQLVLWIAGVHLLGLMAVAVLLLPALRDAPVPPGQHGESDGDDGWGRGPTPTPESPTPPRGGIPLTDAEPARVRFRGPGRLADRIAPRPRRPAHDPAPVKPAQPVGPSRRPS